ncbi:hypothetical protein FB451DRAFT_630247 [Mycena latifolia]|nr:hypothetical protein FB451DRAFT_630247 [Mycena latifolia]
MSRPRRGGKRPAQAVAGPNPLSDSKQRGIDGEISKNEGNEFFVQDDYKEAVDSYKKAIEVNGPQPTYLSNLSAAYLKLKRYDLAEEAATAALNQDPSMSKALYRRAIARKETCQFSAAQEDFRTILAKDPNSVSAKTELSAIEELLAYGTPAAKETSDASKKFVLQLSLAHEDFLDGILAHTFAALRARVTLSVARSAEQALKFLASPDLTAVFVTDPGISEPKHANVLAKLVEYAKSGGSVVLGGLFSSFIAPPKLASFFRDAWGLSWAMGSYHRAYFTLNPAHETVQANTSLLPSYSMKAAHLKGIGAGAAVYADPHGSVSEAPVCQGRIGLGYLGYVGDVNGEQGSTNAVLAMLGVLDMLSAPPQNSGSGIARFILHLAVNKFVDTHSKILSALHELTTVSTVETAEGALPLLASTALGGVFITDTGILQKKHAALLAKLVAYVKAGGTVVLGDVFSAMISGPEMEAFFRDGWGLPWKMASYTRATFVLNRHTNKRAAASPGLVNSYMMKAVLLSGVPAAAALYLPSEESPHFIDRAETPLVFAEVGQGRLGYVGDVNSEEGSTSAILAMFGLEPRSA